MIFRINKMLPENLARQRCIIAKKKYLYTMKRTITLLTALLLAGSAAQQAAAQQAVQHTARIHRTQALPYDTRHEAEQRLRADGGHYIAFTPAVSATDGTSLTVGAEVAIPYEWTDGLVFLHLENVRSAYSLQVNGQPVAEVEDSATPADFDLTPFIRQGDNDIRLVLRESRAEELNADPAMRKAFSESYLYFQTKRSIRDFEIALVPDTLGRDFGMLDLKIIAQNGFNYEEPVTVGYDIYSPQTGKSSRRRNQSKSSFEIRRFQANKALMAL